MGQLIPCFHFICHTDPPASVGWPYSFISSRLDPSPLPLHTRLPHSQSCPLLSWSQNPQTLSKLHLTTAASLCHHCLHPATTLFQTFLNSVSTNHNSTSTLTQPWFTSASLCLSSSLTNYNMTQPCLHPDLSPYTVLAHFSSKHQPLCPNLRLSLFLQCIPTLEYLAFTWNHFISICLILFHSACIFLTLSVCRLLDLYIYMCLFINLFISLFLSQSVYFRFLSMYLCPSTYLSVCLLASISVFVSLSPSLTHTQSHATAPQSRNRTECDINNEECAGNREFILIRILSPTLLSVYDPYSPAGIMIEIMPLIRTIIW